eukprot:gnl/MRDRNA2_/MRDRNA2_178851_c0_seq1.p1 gnl/MRDRNA2_/MRDRNA2_178851_c0~~gnl/MRDRNA2_/MRDRNA2_178851_c0_seq1.p1  ORF type:complete len:258 (+),score=37.30 gnl/MRDRNA2_/MRDRNA2_178851_c0_seq1:110-883(+)
MTKVRRSCKICIVLMVGLLVTCEAYKSPTRPRTMSAYIGPEGSMHGSNLHVINFDGEDLQRSQKSIKPWFEFVERARLLLRSVNAFQACISSKSSLSEVATLQPWNEQQCEQFREAFQIYDQNGDGEITKEEVRAVMLREGQHPTEKELTDMIARYDANRDGTINFSEFCAVMQLDFAKDAAKVTSDPKRLVEAFEWFSNGKAFITRYDLYHSRVKLMEQQLTYEEADEWMTAAHADAEGRIFYAGFKAMMDQHSKK